MARLPTHGIHTALITPFTADDQVDIAAFEALCQRQLDGGIHGLVPCGTTGETPTLTDAEQDAVNAAAIRVAGGKVPITVGIGSNSTRQTLANAERAAKVGADAGLLVFPYYNKPNPKGLIAHVQAVSSVGLPLVLYHVPGRTAHHLPVELLAELANLPGVIAVKEATGDVRYGTDLVSKTDRAVLSGDDFTFLGLLAQGSHGCISVVSNVDPAGTVAVYEHFAAGRGPEAAAALARMWELIGYLFAEVNPVPVKAAVAALGWCRPDLRLPLAGSSFPPPTELLRRLELDFRDAE
jgi:4-hydroxy-tetrahydrodipicolinate synthase